MSKNIRIIGLSSHVEKDKIDKAVSFLENQGHQVSIADQVFEKNGYSAGTVQDKLDALHQAYTDQSVDFILCSVGGNGVIHLLDKIDYHLIQNNPKPICGFSDVTSLLNAIYCKTGQKTYHGPTATQLHRGLPDAQTNQFLGILNGETPPILFEDIHIKNPKPVRGHLIGGNLSVFQTLLGTDYLPDTENAILFFEDIGDEVSRYDRMLAHIKNAGLFNKAAAILFGDFHYVDSGRRLLFGKNMDDVIKDLTSDLNIPVIQNCPFGHRGDLWTFPVGAECRLEFESDNKAKITF